MLNVCRRDTSDVRTASSSTPFRSFASDLKSHEGTVTHAGHVIAFGNVNVALRTWRNTWKRSAPKGRAVASQFARTACDAAANFAHFSMA